MDKVYMITVMRGGLSIKDSPYKMHTCGIYPTLEQATTALRANCNDAFDSGYYEYAVIEETPFGMSPILGTKERAWYKFKDRLVIKVKKPSKYKRIVLFAM